MHGPARQLLKFNLNYINLYNLIRLEEAGTPRNAYVKAYDTLRNCTGSQQNAHFNMVDRALNGVNTSRDADTQRYLDLWLERPRRNFEVNLRGKCPSCGTDRACNPVPVNEWVSADFLWQRSPFSLFGAGDGMIETAAIDYMLPCRMTQYCSLAGRASVVCR